MTLTALAFTPSVAPILERHAWARTIADRYPGQASLCLLANVGLINRSTVDVIEMLLGRDGGGRQVLDDFDRVRELMWLHAYCAEAGGPRMHRPAPAGWAELRLFTDGEPDWWPWPESALCVDCDRPVRGGAAYCAECADFPR